MVLALVVTVDVGGRSVLDFVRVAVVDILVVVIRLLDVQTAECS